jgi:nucleoside-diphosphate-sugar epimerase
MNKVAIIFGGTGYIGSNLIKFLLDNNAFDRYYIYDLNFPLYFESEIKTNIVQYFKVDVREEISIDVANIDINKSWVFNFAAVHREPGHEYKDYFDTNIAGAENINDFTEKNGIKNIFFTSSIAPYGKSINQRVESSNLYPETAYGISKGMCELIHQNWLNKDSTRKLIIVRPSVIYGPKDPGNVYRMIKSLKKGTFVLPNGGRVVKSYGYIHGLVESMLFVINQNKRFIVYNYAENPLIPLNEMVDVVKEELNIKRPTLKLPIWLLVIIASFFQFGFKIIGKKTDVHPTRVRKAGFPTNIKPEYLINNGFNFKYGFRASLKHWKSTSPEDFKI